MPIVQTFQCPNCNGTLEYSGGEEQSVNCPFCSYLVAIPVELRLSKPVPRNVSSADTPRLFSTRHEVREKMKNAKRGENTKDQ
jgi:hypothetical protein